MIDVLLRGGANRHLFHTLERVLASTHGVTVLRDGSICRGERSDFLLWETPELKRVQTPAPILILPQPLENEGEADLCQEAIVVVNSQHPALLKTLSEKNIRVISCGLQTADTLTLSSYTGESAVVSLQRNLVTFSGKVVEPAEFPLTLSSRHDPFTILAVATIYLLSDNQTLLSHLTI